MSKVLFRDDFRFGHCDSLLSQTLLTSINFIFSLPLPLPLPFISIKCILSGFLYFLTLGRSIHKVNDGDLI
jgi:hypothetical protein